MDKPKRDPVTNEMRSALMVNRDGRLTSQQYKNLIAEPLVTLLIILIPGMVVLGPRLAAFIFGGFWIVTVFALVALGAALLFRAMRYARAPIQVGTFYAAENTPPGWMFWKPEVLYTEADKPIRFKRLGPRTPLRPSQTYLVYYLKDAGNMVLLSIAPADHMDAARWQPTPMFQARSARRRKS